MQRKLNKIGYKEALAAVKTLISYIGDDPEREGLLETPERFIKSFNDFFSGYEKNPHEILEKTFTETHGYDEIIVLKDIRFESHCEHHILPIIGTVSIGYLPDKRVVGISKLARIVDLYAKRLQIQEKLTAQIAETINEVLKPKGVGVVINAEHHCMSTRGVHKPGVVMKTSHMLGSFRENAKQRQEFFSLIR